MASEYPSMGDLSGLRSALGLPDVPEPQAASPTPTPTQEPGLPPGAERLPDGQLIRRLVRPARGGSSREQIRYVASTLQEAKAKRWDFWDHRFGWIREGYKLERDRTPQDRMADGSTAGPDPSILKSSV